MDKKTFGSSLSVLRKTEGLTQKQLAEKINVSDKTISKWERDESQPDISIIPKLAEIFGITCDEILKGERYQTTIPYFIGNENINKPKNNLFAFAIISYLIIFLAFVIFLISGYISSNPTLAFILFIAIGVPAPLLLQVIPVIKVKKS